MASKKFKYRYAVGVEYQDDYLAPLLTVKGETFQADEIVKIAKRYGVEVVENDALASGLNHIPLDSEIPEEFFNSVAILLENIDKSLQIKKNQ